MDTKGFRRPFRSVNGPVPLIEFGVRMSLVIVDKQKGGVAGPLEKSVQHEDILKEPIGTQLLFGLTYTGDKYRSVGSEG
jgi:hypothetical protein